MIKTKIAENIKQIKNININIKQIKNKDTVLWPSFDDVIGAPGNRKLLAGNMQAGWFGEVPASDFITGDELARLIGLTAGNTQYSNEPWLKFAYENDVYLIAKKPFRTSLSWDSINAVKAVYGDLMRKIKGKRYAIMLPRGTGKDVQPDPKKMISGYNGAVNHNSMWNMLMLPIHQNAPSGWRYKNNVKSPTENWGVGYTNKDLSLTTFNGCNSWCQDTVANNESNRLARGNEECISSSNYYSSSALGWSVGWRPCLKLVG